MCSSLLIHTHLQRTRRHSVLCTRLYFSLRCSGLVVYADWLMFDAVRHSFTCSLLLKRTSWTCVPVYNQTSAVNALKHYIFWWYAGNLDACFIIEDVSYHCTLIGEKNQINNCIEEDWFPCNVAESRTFLWSGKSFTVTRCYFIKNTHTEYTKVCEDSYVGLCQYIACNIIVLDVRYTIAWALFGHRKDDWILIKR
jgi:hypothetical protein